MKSAITLLSAILLLSLFTASCKKETNGDDSTTKTSDLRSVSAWHFASVPLRFPESELTNDKACGNNRAKIAWYVIDPLFFDTNSQLRPGNISSDDISEDDCRAIMNYEAYPTIKNTAEPMNIAVFEINYYPSERGPWNFDLNASSYSAGISHDGTLNDPASRWGGIERPLPESSDRMNYLEFCLLDPFTICPDASGEMYIDIGDISEDILKDGVLSAENTTEGAFQTTAWGLAKPLTGNACFPASGIEPYDTGLDEIADKDERIYFKSYLDEISSLCAPQVYESIQNDPSNDNYHYFRGNDYDQLNYKVCARYNYYNNQEKNSVSSTNTSYCTISNSVPESEDMNRNGILDTPDNYFEYKISINKQAFEVGSNYIVNMLHNYNVKLVNGNTTESRFYHFRIPLANSNAQYGSPDISSNPKSIRIYLTGFSAPVRLRFISLGLSREPIQFEGWDYQ
ncbi:MAG TPA: cell surface protein SprA [Bacteroidales bacterium]|nr:cell surface protein SprA [Bacteroidales bacterium]